MMVSTRNTVTRSSNGSPLVLDEETKRFLAETIVGIVEGSLANIQRSMADMANDINALSLPQKWIRVEVSEEYAVSLFMGDLPTEIEMGVRMFKLLMPEMETKGEFLEEDEIVVDSRLVDFQAPLISLNALTGTNNFNTMRVIRTIGKNTIHILIDCGSTHNFLDMNMAKQLGCNIRSTYPLAVTVVDGNSLVTDSECKQFKWQFGTSFTGQRG
ncbi:reverse transcriptase [Tanacetum coccineum]